METPFEMLIGEKPDLSHLRIYGCRAYPLRKNVPHLDKLEPRAHIGYLVGYDSANIFRIWIPSKGKIIGTKDVTFDESQYYMPDELDLGHYLRENFEETVTLLKGPTVIYPSRRNRA
jgi:hypothetical protein